MSHTTFFLARFSVLLFNCLGQKSGNYWLLDRNDGSLIWKTLTGPGGLVRKRRVPACFSACFSGVFQRCVSTAHVSAACFSDVFQLRVSAACFSGVSAMGFSGACFSCAFQLRVSAACFSCVFQRRISAACFSSVFQAACLKLVMTETFFLAFKSSDHEKGFGRRVRGFS